VIRCTRKKEEKRRKTRHKPFEDEIDGGSGHFVEAETRQEIAEQVEEAPFECFGALGLLAGEHKLVDDLEMNTRNLEQSNRKEKRKGFESQKQQID
jgi:hypothetical protein